VGVLIYGESKTRAWEWIGDPGNKPASGGEDKQTFRATPDAIRYIASFAKPESRPYPIATLTPGNLHCAALAQKPSW
jgi:hypothetical protein